MTTWTERLDNPFSARLRDPSFTGYVGLALGAFAAFVAIPPIQTRAILWPILVGIVACLLGVWTVTRGRRRLGYGAVASGLIGIGLEGMMLMGAFWGVWAADVGGTWVMGILAGIAVGALLALVYAYFAIHLRADQIVGGTAINFLALGITGYFFFQLYNGGDIPSGVSTIPNVSIPGIADTHFLGPAIGNLNLMIWVGFVLVIVSYIVVFKTPIGLRIRACGEHPRAADTVGINVYAIRYGAVIVSGILAALGGVYLSDGFAGGSYTNNMTNGRGFIALAALIFGAWRPAGAFFAALLFGFSEAVALRLQVYSPQAATLFNVLPYVLTIIAVAGVIGRTVPPAADGKPYKKQ